MSHHDNGEDPPRRDEEPQRPVIDPALLAEAATPEDFDGPAPWDVAAEVLEAVAESGAAEADVAEEPDPEPGPEAAPAPDPEPEVEPAAETESEPDPEPDPEPEEPDPEVEALRAIPLETRLEALLFAAAEPLSLVRLRALTAVEDPLDLRRCLDGLAAAYDEAGRAFTLVEVAGGFQLRTRPELAPVLARLGRKREGDKLSPAALETLAIVAYRQPVLRVDIEKIRGVACGEVLRTLVEKGLVRVAGRAEVPGNPILYGTTPRFLELFGLRNLRDLPSDEQLLGKA